MVPVQCCDQARLTLGEVADFNLSKTGRRWQPVGATIGTRKLFDDEFPHVGAPPEGKWTSP